MGYSVSVRAKNKKSQVLMYEFMRKNYKALSKIAGKEEYAYSRFTSNHLENKEERLSYDGVKLAIGFDYNAAEPERDYIFNICRWMSLKIGKEKEFKEEKGIKIIAPYIHYDGYESWPVLPKSKWKGKVTVYNWCLTTNIGYRPLTEKYKGTPLYEDHVKNGTEKQFLVHTIKNLSKLVGINIEELERLVIKEISRLNREWNKLVSV